MAKYIVRQLEPCWVECFYVVEADDPDDATSKVYCGEGATCIGHTCVDAVDGCEIEGQEAELLGEALPFMMHEERDDIAQFWPKQKATA